MICKILFRMNFRAMLRKPHVQQEHMEPLAEYPDMCTNDCNDQSLKRWAGGLGLKFPVQERESSRDRVTRRQGKVAERRLSGPSNDRDIMGRQRKARFCSPE